ncbi:MAG: hypothetical protein KBT06_04355 [Prevotellaceae bacterium]|nr:hypothetical protein [Candidatus Colivivens equi]
MNNKEIKEAIHRYGGRIYRRKTDAGIPIFIVKGVNWELLDAFIVDVAKEDPYNLWDFHIKDLMDGTIEPEPGQIYFEIEPREDAWGHFPIPEKYRYYECGLNLTVKERRI